MPDNATVAHEQANLTSVGAVVRRGDALLVVRLTYGPTKGRYSFPGGLLDSGEELHTAAEREVWEETRVRARCAGVIGLRTRSQDGVSQTDVMWLLEHAGGEPSPQSEECDDARYLSFDELRARDDVEPLVKTLVERLQAGELRELRLVGANTDGADGTDAASAPPETWRLFL